MKQIHKKPKTFYESSLTRDKVIIEDWNSDDEDDVSEVQIVSHVKTNETQTVKTRVDQIGQTSKKAGIGFKNIKVCFVLWDNAKRVNHQKISKYPHFRKTFVPLGVLTRTGLITPVKQNEKRAVHKVSTARPVSTVMPVSTVRPFAPKIAQTIGAIRPIYPRINNVRPRGSHSPIKRSYYTKPAFRPKDLKQDVKTFRVQKITTARTRVVVNTGKGRKWLSDLNKSVGWRPQGKLLGTFVPRQWIIHAQKAIQRSFAGLMQWSYVSTATTPYVSAASTPTGANAGESSFVYLGGQIPIDASTLPNADLPIDPNIPT
ncbi:hypothetical protein Tco_0092415 [Tanacetum coccineum]